MQPAAVRVTDVGLASDTPLVRRARDGDTAAFDALAATRLPGAYRLAAAILGSESSAADATQDALVAAWQELPRLRDPDRFDAWFRRILVNECRMAIRRRGRVREVGLDTVAEPSPGGPAQGRPSQPSLEGLEALDQLEQAFERLDPDDRVLVVLHHLEDRPLKEIAETVRMPVGTVKWRLHVARGELARALEALE